MQADNNWKDTVGQKLFDFEGELSPQAWENINRRIKPKPKRRWPFFWLPALLLLIALPAAFYYYNNSGKKEISNINQTTQSNKNQSETITEKQQLTTAKTPLATTRPAAPEATATTQSAPEKVVDQDKFLPESDLKNTNQQLPIIALAKPKKATIKPVPVLVAEQDEKPKNKAENNARTGQNLNPAVGMAAAENQKNKTNKNASKTTKESARISANNELVLNPAEAETKPETEIVTTLNNQTETESHNQNQLNAGGQEKADAGARDKAVQANHAGTNLATDQPENVNPEAASILVSPVAKVDSVDQVEADSVAAKPETATATQPEPDSAATLFEPETGKVKKWQFSLYASSQYTFQRVSPNLTDDVLILRMNNKNEWETERMGYEISFRSLYPITEKLELETGIHFARLNQHLDFTMAGNTADSTFIPQQNGSILLQINRHEEREVLLFKYYFGGVYAGANLKLSHQLSITGGMGGNWLLWKNPDEKTVPVETKLFNPHVSAGLRYYQPVSKSVMLTMGPTLQYYIRAVQKETVYYGSKPTTVGFSVGLLLNR